MLALFLLLLTYDEQFGKGWVKKVSTFFSTFGIFPTKGADS